MDYIDHSDPIKILFGDNYSHIQKYLLVNPQDVNIHHNQHKDTPLISAIRNGRIDIAELLLFFKADVNAKGYQGTTALHLAAGKNDYRALEILIEAGAHGMIENDFGRVALNMAFSNYLTLKTVLMLHPITDINAITSNGMEDNMLITACKDRVDIDIIEYIMEYTNDLNYQNRKNKGVFHAIIKYHDKDGWRLVKKLVKRGADINYVGMGERSILSYAIYHEDISYYDDHLPIMISTLCEFGADVNAIDNNGMSILMNALEAMATEATIIELLAYGADVNYSGSFSSIEDVARHYNASQNIIDRLNGNPINYWLSDDD